MKEQDKLGLYTSIALNEGAYFFKKGNLKISKRLIDSVFSMVTADNCKKLTVVVRKNEMFGEPNQKTAIVSLLIFKNISTPSFIKIDGVSVGESGLKIEGKKQILTLDVSYHDKCDLTYSEYLNFETGEVEIETFNKVLKNASKYNKTLKEEISQ